MVFNLSDAPSVAQIYVQELRDVNIQKDPMRFRFNLERIAWYFGIKISEMLDYTDIETETPLGMAPGKVLAQQPVIATILRAGLPMHQGMLAVFDRAESAFITAYRQNDKGNAFHIEVEHISKPNLEGKTVILTDPMLATGLSMVKCAKQMINGAKINQLHIVAAIASLQGLQYVQANLPKAHIWVGAVDDELTSKSYIVPGLGDAGDLAYGDKL